MGQAGEGPTVALLRAACRRGVRGPGEGSQALALCHWRRTFTPPGELKTGGIMNKSALTGLRVKGAATGRAAPAQAPALGQPGGRKHPAAKGSSSLFTAKQKAAV